MTDSKLLSEEEINNLEDAQLKNVLKPLTSNEIIYNKLIKMGITINALNIMPKKNLSSLCLDLELTNEETTEFINAINKYKDKMISSNPQKYDHSVKLLIIGDSGVGKTCLLLRWTEGQYNKVKLSSTVGVDLKIKYINTGFEIVKCQIWDSAGQERFKTIINAYFRGANGILICYDITDESTFDNIRNWITKIEEYTDNKVIVFIVGLKTDLENKRIISYKKGKELADEYSYYFMEASAKINSNVDQVFRTMVSYIMHYKVRNKQKNNDNNNSNSNINLQTSNKCNKNDNGICCKFF